MLKKQSKLICLAMALVFCLSFIAIAPPAAMASTYSAVKTPTLKTNTPYDNAIHNGVNNGYAGIMFQVDIPEVAALTSGDVLTISLPTGLKFIDNARTTFDIETDASKASGDHQAIYVPAKIGDSDNALDIDNGDGDGINTTISGVIKTSTSADITVTTSGQGEGRFFVYLNAIKTGSTTGTLTATLQAPSNSGFTSGTVALASNSSGGGTVAGISSVPTFGTSGLTCDDTASSPLVIAETAVGSLHANSDWVKLKLPAGFEWDLYSKTLDTNDDNVADTTMQTYLENSAGGWGYSAGVVENAQLTDDGRTLKFQVDQTSSSMAGRIAFPFAISVADESVAKQGDVTVHISGDNVTEQDLVIAKYGSYSATVTAGTTTTVYAGKSDQKIGEFYIEESLAGSVLADRTIKLTLPDGVRWWNGYDGQHDSLSSISTIDGDQDMAWKSDGGTAAFTDSGRTIKLSLDNLTTDAGKWKVKDLYVDVSPTFSGDIKVTVSGDAAVSGEVTVATAKPAVEVSVENAKNVVIGTQDQALGDIIIKETAAENIALHPSKVIKPYYTYTSTDSNGNVTYLNEELISSSDDGDLVLTLPTGATWSGYPTVTVTDGDVQFNTSGMSKSSDGRTLTIPVKSTSSTASTVKITGLKATLDRSVPEGALNVDVTGYAINEVSGDDNDLPFGDTGTLEAKVATVATPAPSDTEKVGQFVIGSNIYTVNGSQKIMDVAPYIKAGRTYVPVRYLAYALGLTDDQIKWDAATQTVTFTKGTDTVSVVIGSKTLTKNGTATTMDVAPEIKNSRTMLPARWIAEAFGATVGWDPTTQTVLIQSTVQ